MEEEKNELEDIKDELDEFFKKIMMLDLLGSDLVYLHPKDNTYHNSIFGSIFFLRLIESHKVNFALHFIKLLDKREHNNLFSFLKRLLLHHKKASWKQSITLGELQDIENKIDIIIDSKEFKCIKHIRDKVYAHSDKGAEDTDLKTTQDDVMIHVNTLKYIINELGSKICKIAFQMEMLWWDIDHDLLSKLSNYCEVIDNFKILKYERNEEKVGWEEIEEWITKY